MTIKSIILNDFRGGMRTANASGYLPNESSQLFRLWPTEGSLRSFEGRNQVLVSEFNNAVLSHKRFYLSGQSINNSNASTVQALTVAKSADGWMYIDVGKISSSGASNPAGASDFRPVCERPGASIDAERFAVYGNRLYMADGIHAVMRWDGGFYAVGKCKASGTTALSGSDGATPAGVAATKWNSYSSVKKGYTVYFRLGVSWGYSRQITAIGGDQSITLDSALNTTGAGSGGSDWVDYIIVPTFQMGISAGPQATAVAAAGVGLADGDYTYTYTYANSLTGYESNRAPVSNGVTCGAGSNQVTVGGWDAYPADTQIDQVRIYRSKVGAPGLYFYLATISRSGALNTFAATYTDSTPDASLATTTAPTRNNPPPVLKGLIEYGDRLYGWGSDNILRFSTLGYCEHWPDLDFSLSDPSLFPVSAGGKVFIGQSIGESIKAVVVEGGAYESTGLSGSNLLVFTESRAYRWFGWDWSEFARVEAFGVGCVAPKTALNAAGWIYWVSKRGVERLASGSNTPEVISAKIWPQGVLPSMTAATSTPAAIMAQWAAAYWNGQYVMAYGAGVLTSNNYLLVYDTVMDTWINGAYWNSFEKYNDFTIWDGPGDSGEIYASDATTGKLWRLFATTTVANVRYTYSDPSTPTGVSCRYRSRPLWLADLPQDLYKVKRIIRILACWKQPTASQNVTFSVFTNGETTTPAWSGVSAVSSAGVDRLAFTEVHPENAVGRMFQLQFDGTFTRPMELLWIQVDYTIIGELAGEIVG
jgi:hypothetical protein